MTALMPMASSRLGKARKMSKNCERTASVLPPKYPAIRPKKIPMPEGQRRRKDADRQGNARAVHHACEDVPALAVRAEEMRLARRLLQAVQVHRKRIVGNDIRPRNSGESQQDEQDHGDQGRRIPGQVLHGKIIEHAFSIRKRFFPQTPNP